MLMQNLVKWQSPNKSNFLTIILDKGIGFCNPAAYYISGITEKI